MKFATCHPDRFHVAKGLCKVCYNRQHNISDNNVHRRAAKRRANKTWRMTPLGRAKNLLLQAKATSRSLGKSFNLTLEDIVIPSHCPVLGIPLDCSAKRPSDNLPSLDRIDNAKGYIKGNVWVISWRANFIKGDASLVELRSLVKALDDRAVVAFRASAHAKLTGNLS